MQVATVKTKKGESKQLYFADEADAAAAVDAFCRCVLIRIYVSFDVSWRDVNNPRARVPAPVRVCVRA
jgi:hypothetical protein